MRHTFLFVIILVPLLILGCGDKSNHRIYTSVLKGKTIHVPALTGGKILDIFVNTGQEILAGDTLAVIDTTELVLQYEQSQGSLQELEVQEGITRTNLDRAKADLDYVQEKYERIKSLYEQQAAPEQDLDDLGHQLQQVQSAFKSAQDQIQILEARLKQLAAQIGTIRKKISDAVIVAPADGLVATRYYEKGEAVPPLQPIVELVTVSELDAKIYIPEEMLPEVKPGQKARIRVDGLAEDLSGRISWVSPKAEFTPKTILTPETRTSLVYAVKVTVLNPKRVLKHGMPVEVIL